MIEGFAVKDTENGECVVFGSGGGGAKPPATQPQLDIRCLRTERGCRRWLRGNKYGSPEANRYRLLRIKMGVEEIEGMEGLALVIFLKTPADAADQRGFEKLAAAGHITLAFSEDRKEVTLRGGFDRLAKIAKMFSDAGDLEPGVVH